MMILWRLRGLFGLVSRGRDRFTMDGGEDCSLSLAL
jgi:hypothetical protein